MRELRELRLFSFLFGIPVVAVSFVLWSPGGVLSNFLAASGVGTFGCWLISIGYDHQHPIWKSAQRRLMPISLGCFIASRIALDFQRGRPGDAIPFIILMASIVWSWKYFRKLTERE